MSNHEKVETTQQSIAILDAAINSILEDDQNSKNVASAVDKLHAHSPGVNTAIERLSPVKTAREGRSPRAIDAKKQPTSSVRTAKSPIVQIQTGRSRSPVATAKDSSNSTRSALSPSNKSKRAQPKNGKQPTTVRTDRSIPSDRSRSTKTGLSVTPTKSYIKLSRSDVKAALGKKKGVTGLSKLLRDVSDVNTGREKSGSSTNSDASSTTKKKLTPAEQWKHVQSGPGPKIVPKEAASSDASLKTARETPNKAVSNRQQKSKVQQPANSASKIWNDLKKAADQPDLKTMSSPTLPIGSPVGASASQAFVANRESVKTALSKSSVTIAKTNTFQTVKTTRSDTSETNLHTAREKSSRKPFQTQEPFRTGRSPSYGTERSPDPATAKSPIVSATKFELFVVILYGLIYLLFTISLFIALLARHVLIWLLSSSQYGKKDPVGDGPAKTAIKAFLNSVKGFAQAANFDAYDESNAKNIFLSVEEKPDLKSKKLKYWLVPFPAIFGFDGLLAVNSITEGALHILSGHFHDKTAEGYTQLEKFVQNSTNFKGAAHQLQYEFFLKFVEFAKTSEQKYIGISLSHLEEIRLIFKNPPNDMLLEQSKKYMIVGIKKRAVARIINGTKKYVYIKTAYMTDDLPDTKICTNFNPDDMDLQSRSTISTSSASNSRKT